MLCQNIISIKVWFFKTETITWSVSVYQFTTFTVMEHIAVMETVQLVLSQLKNFLT